MKVAINGTVGHDKDGQPINITNIYVEGGTSESAEVIADEFNKAKEKIKEDATK